jgi:phenylacetate-CoA ligase
VFDERGLKPKDIQDFNDLQKLPFLTKELVRENLDDLKAKNFPNWKFEYVNTGGSMSGTAKPFGLFYEKGDSRAREWAFMKTQWDRVGYHFTDKCVVLRGYVDKSENPDKFGTYSLFGRWLILSSFLMSDKNLPDYIEKIRRFKPKYIQAFPSVITTIAEYMYDYDIKPFPSVRALLCGSENLYGNQRDFLRNVFQCRVYSWYGHAEQSVLAGECEVNSKYHIFPEYGIVELVDKSGKEIKRDNKLGEIVATGLNNYIMPFIRYKTMDLAEISNECCECGRNYRLISRIEGRIQEMIVTKDNRLISLPAFYALALYSKDFHQIKKVQFIQEKEGKILIRIIKGRNYTKEDETDILNKIRKNLGDRLNAEIEYVDYISPTHVGKHMKLIQKLPVELRNYS